MSLLCSDAAQVLLLLLGLPSKKLLRPLFPLSCPPPCAPALRNFFHCLRASFNSLRSKVASQITLPHIFRVGIVMMAFHCCIARLVEIRDIIS